MNSKPSEHGHFTPTRRQHRERGLKPSTCHTPVSGIGRRGGRSEGPEEQAEAADGWQRNEERRSRAKGQPHAPCLIVPRLPMSKIGPKQRPNQSSRRSIGRSVHVHIDIHINVPDQIANPVPGISKPRSGSRGWVHQARPGPAWSKRRLVGGGGTTHPSRRSLCKAMYNGQAHEGLPAAGVVNQYKFPQVERALA